MIKPLFNNIVIEQIEAETKTTSGLYIPEGATEKPEQANVVAVSDKSNLKVGDKVFYKKWGGSEIKIDGKNYIIIEEEDILATYE
jgi:chaperonin GroES